MTERTLDQIGEELKATLSGQAAEEPEEDLENEELPEEEIDNEAEEVEEVEQSDAEKALALGWKPFQEYTDAGGNPDMYRGATAFLQFHDQKKKAKEENASMKADLDRIAEMMVEEKKNRKANEQREREKMRKELEAELKQAKDDLDIDAYDKAKDQLAELGDDEPEPEVIPEPAFFAQFRADNPKLDHSSPEFNHDLAEWMSSRVVAAINKQERLGVRITEAVQEKVIMEELERTKRAFPEEFGEQPARPVRRRQAPRTAESPASTGAKASRKLDAAAQKVYDRFVRDGRKDAAEEFKRNMLAEA